VNIISRSMKKLIIIAIVAAFVFSCEHSTDYPSFQNMDVTSEFVLNNAIIISEGDCAGDMQNHTYICLVSVLNDSRCPLGVECFWQGNAQTRFKFVKSGEEPFFFNLNTYLGFTNDTIIGGYKFTLKSLNPYPDIKKPIFQRDYKAEIEIEKETE
jgi:hypothetical protein